MRSDNKLYKEALRRETVKEFAMTLVILGGVFLLTGLEWWL